MTNIGYAVFTKRSPSLEINCNGLFKDLKLSNQVTTILKLLESTGFNRKVLSLHSVSSKNSKHKDVCLVTLVECIKIGEENLILGSAISFTKFQVNEKKVMDGVQYLLSQLKRNFQNSTTSTEEYLGVILPSPNKDFKIFKNGKLPTKLVEDSSVGFKQAVLSNFEDTMYILDFYNNKDMHTLDYLLLAENTDLFNTKGFKNLNSDQVIAKPTKATQAKSTKAALSPKSREIFETENKKLTTEKIKYKNQRDLYKVLTIVLGCLFFVLGYVFLKRKTTSNTLDNKELYTIEDNFYINNSNYNVNVRSSPNVDQSGENIKTTLSDGDKVFLLGFDKQTLWAKISYNDNTDQGYVSNTLIEGELNENRLLPINKKAIINTSLGVVPLYVSPKEITKENPEILLYIKKDDRILVKNKVLRNNTFSIRFKKYNKIYNGYISDGWFTYE